MLSIYRYLRMAVYRYHDLPSDAARRATSIFDPPRSMMMLDARRSTLDLHTSHFVSLATTMSACITHADVLEAAQRIQGTAHRTPVLQSSTLNELSSRNLFFKVEALQKTGSFKFRGALNAIRSLLLETAASEGPLQVVTHSSGNHAQALALAAQLSSTQLRTVHATIAMPDSTPSVKQRAVEAYGGAIVVTASNNEAREAAAAQIQQETGATFIHPSEDPKVIAGQGTVCLEMIEQMQPTQPDVVIIPVGGGGLAAGNITSVRGLLGDRVKLVLAEPQVLDDAHRSFQAGQLLGHDPDNTLDSVADGLKTTLGPHTWPIVRDGADAILTVSEKEILAATKLVWERLKVCIEPSAGVGVAVALSDEFQSRFPAAQYPNVGIVLCGGNVDVIKIAKKMEAMGL